MRRAGVRAFYLLNPGDITIRHQWTREPFRLHSFKHKGYWFHFADGQRDSLLMAARLMQPGQYVADIGGNIGYFTAFFAAMVGTTGHVDVFEPSPGNLKYLYRNAAPHANVEVFDCALSDAVGEATFFVEDLTGQNCSLMDNYAPLQRNSRSAGISARVRKVTVPTDTLDTHYRSSNRLDFVKIDVEGGELNVLQGGSEILRRLRPMLLLEISMNHDEVLALLRQNGYVLTSPCGAAADVTVEKADYFAFHRSEHSRLLDALGVDGPSTARAPARVSS